MEASTAAATIAMMAQMAEDPRKCQALVQDDTCVGGLVMVLSNKEDQVVKIALQTLKKLSARPAHRPRLAHFIGMKDQLDMLTNTHPNVEIQSLAQEVKTQLLPESPQFQKPPPVPAATTQPPSEHKTEIGKRGRRNSMCVKSNLQNAKTVVLHIRGMHDKDDMDLCRRMLIEVKGVISITFDFKKKHSILRARPDLNIETLAKAISKTYTMVAEKVTKDFQGNEIIEPIDYMSTSMHEDEDDMPDYPDDDSPIRGTNTLTRLGGKPKQGWNMLKSVGEFISTSFYWWW